MTHWILRELNMVSWTIFPSRSMKVNISPPQFISFWPIWSLVSSNELTNGFHPCLPQRFHMAGGRLPLRSAGRVRRYSAGDGARMPVPDGCDGHLDHQRWLIFMGKCRKIQCKWRFVHGKTGETPRYINMINGGLVMRKSSLHILISGTRDGSSQGRFSPLIGELSRQSDQPLTKWDETPSKLPVYHSLA